MKTGLQPACLVVDLYAEFLETFLKFRSRIGRKRAAARYLDVEIVRCHRSMLAMSQRGDVESKLSPFGLICSHLNASQLLAHRGFLG